MISSGFAETGEEGRQRQRRLVGPGPLLRPAADRPELPRHHQHRSRAVASTPRCRPVMPPRGRAGFFCQSGALGSAILEKVNNRGLGLSTFVSAGNRADVSGNDLLQYWEEDDATEVVLLYLESIGNPRKFSRIARRVSPRKPIIAVRSGRTTQGVPMGHAVRQIAAPPAAVDAMFRQAGDHPGGHAGGDVRRRPAAGPPAAAARTPGRDRRQLRRARACSPPTPPRRSAWSSTSPSRSVPTRPPRTSRTRSTRPSTIPTSTPWSRSTSRRSTSPARTSPTCWPRSASSPTSRWSPRSSAPRASPSCCGCPTSPAARAGRGSVPSYPAVEAAVRALARVVGVRRVAAHPRRAEGRPRRHRPGAGEAAGQRGADETTATAPTSTRCELRRPAGGVRHRPVGDDPGRRTLEEAVAAAGRRSAGTSCSRRPPTTCASAPTWPTCGATSTPPPRCATPGSRSTA